LDVEEDGSHALLTLLFGEAASLTDSDGTEQNRELSGTVEIASFRQRKIAERLHLSIRRKDRPAVQQKIEDGELQVRSLMN
jgi:hypothetical protein